jgi:hypothetical protein
VGYSSAANVLAAMRYLKNADSNETILANTGYKNPAIS